MAITIKPTAVKPKSALDYLKASMSAKPTKLSSMFKPAATKKAGLYTLAEAAHALGISIKTLRMHVKQGRIGSSIVGNGTTRKTRRFTSQDIASFIADQKIREVPTCPSTSPKTPLITMPGLNSTVIAFTSLPKQKTKKTPK